MVLVFRIMINLLIGRSDCVGTAPQRPNLNRVLIQTKTDQEIKSVAAELLPSPGWAGLMDVRPSNPADKFAKVSSNLTREPKVKRIWSYVLLVTRS